MVGSAPGKWCGWLELKDRGMCRTKRGADEGFIYSCGYEGNVDPSSQAFEADENVVEVELDVSDKEKGEDGTDQRYPSIQSHPNTHPSTDIHPIHPASLASPLTFFVDHPIFRVIIRDQGSFRVETEQPRARPKGSCPVFQGGFHRGPDDPEPGGSGHGAASALALDHIVRPAGPEPGQPNRD
jgi:hypothetical protein